ncbi:UNKNOWN [Stylonychia lemnae]|uniref:Uncharacterized protein n=1 Tax=Stylonychia lemnae TaxID=5949 RepID=A0A078AGD1_STYLE|nr:UNKNOWN [Stylonychia lemnae]|eukprot:CDW81294.1 UNKNOWN [Stylonychia lemnae]
MNCKDQLLLQSPLTKAHSLNTRNYRTDPINFNLKLQQTLSYNTSHYLASANASHPKLKLPHQGNTSGLNKEISQFTIGNKSRQSKFSQKKKPQLMFEHLNASTGALDSSVIIAQNPDYSFNSRSLFHPARHVDVKKLRCQSMMEKKKKDFMQDLQHQKEKLIEVVHKKKKQSIDNGIDGQPEHNKSINDIVNEEPEKPLTGYNYRKYFNEAHIVLNATKSAIRLKNINRIADLSMIEMRKGLQQQKYEILRNKTKLKAPVISINKKSIV